MDGIDQPDPPGPPAGPVSEPNDESADRHPVADPDGGARSTRDLSGVRRFLDRYPGAVVAGACLGVLAVVVGVRSVGGDSLSAAASTGPTIDLTTSRPLTSAGTVTGTTVPSTPISTVPSTPTSTTTPATTATAPGSSQPLTSAIGSAVPLSSGAQALAGAALARNPAIRFTTGARRQVLAGVVDVRLSTVLAAVAAQDAVTVDSFQAVAGDPAGSPVRQVTLSATRPADAGALTRALAAQSGDFALQAVPTTGATRTVRLRTVAGR